MTWAKSLLLDGRSPSTNKTVVPSAIIASTRTPHTIVDAVKSSYSQHVGTKQHGLGQFVYNYRGNQIIDHFGAVPGQKTRVALVPEAGLGIVIMANDEEFGSTYVKAAQYTILDRLLGLDALNWKSL